MKILTAILMVLISLNAHAEWVGVYSDANEIDYVDTASIKGSGNIRQIGQLRNFKNVQAPRAGFEHLSKFHLYEFNCSQKTFKVLLTVAYELNNGKGRGVFKDDIPTPTYEGFRAGTSTEQTWRIACK